jgi:hypothetical protein
MFTVELYAGIRRAVMVDGLSRREAAKRFGVHRNTITKMLQFSIPPGHAPADSGQADGYIAGKKVRFHYFCVDLPHADGCFVKAYLAETAEAFCDGHLAAFDFFGGVPRSILSSNTRLRWPGSSRQMEKRTCGVRARKCSPNSRAITCSTALRQAKAASAGRPKCRAKTDAISCCPKPPHNRSQTVLPVALSTAIRSMSGRHNTQPSPS